MDNDINVTIAEKLEYTFEVTENTLIVNVGNELFQSNGDMFKTIYDTNNNGVVDTCEYVDGGTF